MFGSYYQDSWFLPWGTPAADFITLAVKVKVRSSKRKVAVYRGDPNGATGSRSNRFISNCNSKPLGLIKGIFRLPLPSGKLVDSLLLL